MVDPPKKKPTTYQITGIPVPFDYQDRKAVPFRYEVDKWATSTDLVQNKQVDLFVQALNIFESMSPDDKLSYFQIAGIHGLPLVPWDEWTDAKMPMQGYCTHGSLLFPTWHRPYVLLFEQRLWEIMKNQVIPAYDEDDQPAYIQAADLWRLPYWDWAEKKSQAYSPTTKTYSMPIICRNPRILIQGPQGPQYVKNPMYSFSMPDGRPMGSRGIFAYTDPTDAKHMSLTSPYELCVGTSRYVPVPQPYGYSLKVTGDYSGINAFDSPEWVKGMQDNGQAEDAFRGHAWYQSSRTDTFYIGPFGLPIKVQHIYKDDLGEAVYRLFSEKYFSSYNEFASTAAWDPKSGRNPPDFLSIEDIHNDIHNWTGGQGYLPNGQLLDGHMTDVPVAAFDPIFWMHHANVDRIFAIWQELNPGAWFGDPFHDSGNWSIAPGTLIDGKTELAPFHKDTKGTLYTSNDIRDYTKLGYSYPELDKWNYANTNEFQAAIRKTVKELYATTTTLFHSIPDEIKEKVGKTDNDYIVNVSYDRFALGGRSFTIHIFLGDVPDNRSALHLHPHRVGSVYNFAGLPPALDDTQPGCANCGTQAKSGQKSVGQVHITNALVKELMEDNPLDELNADKVSDYLSKNLHWRVTSNKGMINPSKLADEMPSLKVSLAVGTADHPTEADQLSSYKDYRPLFDATKGRPGGAVDSGI